MNAQFMALYRIPPWKYAINGYHNHRNREVGQGVQKMNPQNATVKAHRSPWKAGDGLHTSHGYDLIVRKGKVVKATIPQSDGTFKDARVFMFQRGYGWVDVTGLRSYSSVVHGLSNGKYRIV